MRKDDAVSITVELFGVPRLKVGRPAVDVDACTVGEALSALEARFPVLRDSVLQNGQLLPAYITSINAGKFVRDPRTPLQEGDVLLLMSATSGG